jgi:hypothetical protein
MRVDEQVLGTVRWSNTRHSWWTTPMPRSRAAVGVGMRVARRRARSAAIRLVHAEQDLHQRRLARAVLADKRGDRAAMQLEVHACERAHAAEGLADVGERQEGGHGRFACSENLGEFATLRRRR